VISAHWEETHPTITSGQHPPLIYDYYGFPKAAYEIQYPVKGAPDLAKKIHSLLLNTGIDSRLNKERGFDHGVFIPLKIMYPEADIPCVQLSLKKELNPKDHIRMGQSLTTLLDDEVLIIGSGFSFHNLRAFFSPPTPDTQSKNAAFEQWLTQTCTDHYLSEEERKNRLEKWEDAPAARYCHPREEHLLPLHVCYGIAGSAAIKSWSINIMGKQASSFLW
jgi:aromatic ring-opening dioxygenase catalytic subunit (LigB family)